MYRTSLIATGADRGSDAPNLDRPERPHNGHFLNSSEFGSVRRPTELILRTPNKPPGSSWWT